MEVVLPFKDRPNYLRITLASYIEAIRGRNDIHLTLYDDCSSTIPAIVNEVPNATLMKRKKCLGQYQSKAAAIQDTFNHYANISFVLCLDSDCIIHPGIFNAIANMIKDLPNMGIGTVFNTPTHPEISCVLEKYVTKEHIGGLGTVIKKDAWEWYVTQTRTNGAKHIGWDWDICLWLKTTEKWKIFSTIRSYVDHIGQSGSHSGPGCNIDRARRFLE